MEEQTRPFKRVPINIAVTGLGQVLANLLVLASTILTARYLGVGGFGRFSFFFGIALVCWFIGEAGLMNILVRELSQRLKNKKDYDDYLSSFRGLISSISLVTLTLAGVFAWLGPLDLETRAVLFLLALSIVAMFQAVTLTSVIRAYEDMLYYALASILQNIVLLGGIYLVIRLDAGFTAIFVAYAAAFLFTWVFNWVLVRLRYGLPVQTVNFIRWRYFLKESLPLGLGHILRRIGNYMGIFLLKGLSTAVDVGLFSTALRLILALAAIAVTICFPFLPVFSKLALENNPQLNSGLEKGLKFLVIMAIPLTISFFVYGQLIITTLFGVKFLEAGQALQLLSLSLLFIFPGTLFLHFFTAIGKQQFWSISTGTCLGINLLFNLLFIPKWGYWGAAWATLIAEAVLFGISWFLLRQLDVRLSLTSLVSRPLLIGIVIGGILFQFPGASLFQMIGHGTTAIALYGLLLILLRVVTPKTIFGLIRGQT
jgi:O-antigen/teichoic acid export membrane protein